MSDEAYQACTYVDPAGLTCPKVAAFEIIEDSNEVVAFACQDHAETMQLAAPTGATRQVHPIGSKPTAANLPPGPGSAAVVLEPTAEDT